MESNLDSGRTVPRMNTMKAPVLLLALSVACVASSPAQETKAAGDPDPAYTKVITERAEKIVATLNLTDPAKAGRVRDLVAQQYRSLRAIHDPLESQAKAAKAATAGEKEAAEANLKAAQADAKVRLDKLHAEYLARLATELSTDQVDKVKDGMTYGIVQVTYNTYLQMYPQLTEEQKTKILSYLVEARETAMDLGSSDAKHQWFGKYKGRINNYLSSAGYDLKAASKKPTAAPTAPDAAVK